MRRILIIGVFLSSIFCYSGNLQPLKINEKIKIDGKLNEVAWQKAQKSSNFVYLETFKKKENPPETYFKILYDSQAVYFGIYCSEPYMNKLKDNKVPRDSAGVFLQDCIEIFVDPEGRGVNYYQFALSAGNIQWDSYWIEGGNTQGGEYNGLWESATYKGENFWTVEVKIPFSAFYRTPSSSFSSTWKINVTRERKPLPQLLTWTPLRRSFHEPHKFNRVSGMPVKSSKDDIEILSYKYSVGGKGKEGYNVKIDLKINSSKKAAGKYEIKLFDGNSLITNAVVNISPGNNKIVLNNFNLKTLGKKLLKCEITSDKFKGGTYLALNLSYNPIKIVVNQPFYSRCIFPDQKISEIKGTIAINYPVSSLKSPEVLVSFAGNGIKKEKRYPAKEKMYFSIRTGELKEGDYKLRVSLISDGKEITGTETEIKKLKKPKKGNYVYIDKNLNLVVDGKPMFVRGWYGGRGWMVSEAILEKYPQPDSPYVNAFECSVGMEAERIDKGEVSRIKNDVKPSKKVFDVMKKRIEENRSKNFLWYYLADEPECRGLSPVYLKYQYEFIKKLDPYHPVMIISRAPSRYTECADILNPHPYLNPVIDSKGKRKLSRSVKFIRDVIREVYTSSNYRIPAWCTPQAFSYGFVDPQADYPTFKEYRCMVYTSVVNGAKGFTPFIYNAHFNTVDLRYGCNFVYQSLAYLEKFLLTYPVSETVEVKNPEKMVDVMVKKKGKEILVIAVNLLDKPTKAVIKSPVLRRTGYLYGFRENRKEKVYKGEISLNFSPYQVIILTSRKMGKNLKTVDELEKEIEVKKSRLRKPGNILYGRGKEIEWAASDDYISPKSLFSLTDGVCDTLGWKDVRGRVKPAFVEAMFPTFVPEFKKAVIYTSTVDDMEFYIWKYGEWKKVGEAKRNNKDFIEFNFPEKLRTVKIKIIMKKVKNADYSKIPGKKLKAEVYEIELY